MDGAVVLCNDATRRSYHHGLRIDFGLHAVQWIWGRGQDAECELSSGQLPANQGYSQQFAGGTVSVSDVGGILRTASLPISSHQCRWCQHFDVLLKMQQDSGLPTAF